MTLTFGDAARIEQELAEEGGRGREEDLPALLQDVGAWFESNRGAAQFEIDGETFALVCDHARRDGDDRVKALAVGALRLTRRYASADPAKTSFLLKFALQRILALTGRSLLWGSVELSAKDEEDARALFEAALDDKSYRDEELFETVHAFVEEYGREGYMFGRLASDLAFLEDVIEGDGFSSQQRRIARAALTYFAVVSDAIPDDLGLVGLLDDVFITQRAVQEIRPERGYLTELLGKVVEEWPFLRDLRLDSSGISRPLSEFVLVNSAALLPNRKSEADRTALVISEVESLPFLLGYIRGLAEIRTHLRESERPLFSVGERLINRETRAEAIFEGYGRFKQSAFIPCSSNEATHFRFTTQTSHRKQTTVKHTHIIEGLDSFRRSGRQEGGLRPGRVGYEQEGLDVGPLEHLFGSTVPIVLPEKRGAAIVVGKIGQAKRLAKTLNLFGTPLVEALPIGHAYSKGDVLEHVPWTRQQAGGAPILIVVTAISEAVLLVEEKGSRFVAVVAPVKGATTDAMNLARIAEAGTPVIGIAEERDTEAHEDLESAGFNFWCWEPKWLETLHWSPANDAEEHPLRKLDLRVSQRRRAQVSAITVPLPDLADAYQALKRIEQLSGEKDSEVLAAFVADSVQLMLGIARSVCPIDDEKSSRLSGSVTGLREAIDRAVTWWDDETLALAKRLQSCLASTVAAASVTNPKWTAVVEWARKHPDGALLSSRAEADRLQSALADTGVFVCTDRKAVDWTAPVLVPAWQGRDRMERLLVPLPAQHVELILYPPENDWYEAHVRRERSRQARLGVLASRRQALPIVLPEPPQDAVRISVPPSDEPETLILRARRSHAIRHLGTGREEVRTTLIHFAGGSWGAFTGGHRLNTVTHLVGDVDEHSEESAIRETAVSSLVPGDLVLMRRGASRGAVREAVDAVAEEGLREAAGEWRLALLRFIQQGNSIQGLTKYLEDAGCRRTEETVKRWLHDENMIAPQDGRRDIEAICRATADMQLIASLDDCVTAIEELRGLHMRMARSLARQVLDRAREYLSGGVPPEELIEIEDRLVLVTVEFIDPESIDAPRSEVNRLQESQWRG